MSEILRRSERKSELKLFDSLPNQFGRLSLNRGLLAITRKNRPCHSIFTALTFAVLITAVISATFLPKDAVAGPPLGNGVVSVTDFGAIPNDGLDDTIACQDALNAVPPSGGGVYFPPGTYRVDSLTVSSPTKIFGAGSSSKITATTPNNNLITVNAGESSIENLHINSSVTRTGGAYVLVNAIASDFAIKNFSMLGHYWGIRTLATSVRIGPGSMRDGISSLGVGIIVDGGFAVSIDSIVMDAPAQTAAGIWINATGDTLITRSNIIHQGNALVVAPGAGQVVASLWVDNTYFDTSDRGLLINPSDTGSVVRARFSNSWFSSNNLQGVLIFNQGTGTIGPIEFISPHVLSNGSHGFQVESTGAISDIHINGGVFADNAGYGVTFGPNLQGFSIANARVGNAADLAGNTSDGIIVHGGGTADYYRIVNNDVRGNSGQGIVAQGGTASKIVSGNIQ